MPRPEPAPTRPDRLVTQMAIEEKDAISVDFSIEVQPHLRADQPALHEFVCQRLQTRYDEMASVTMSPAANVPRRLSLLKLEQDGTLLKAQSVWLPISNDAPASLLPSRPPVPVPAAEPVAPAQA